MPTDDTFGRFYAAVNVEWPQFGMADEEAEQQERRWRFALGSFPPESLAHAMKQALRFAKKRPKVADLIEWAQEHSAKIERPTDRVLPHWTRCACGCGGKLWYLVLRDPVTNAVRHHAKTVEGMTNQLTHRVAENPAVAEPLAVFCGQPMLRTKCACLKRGGDPLPDESFYVGLEGTVPVYDALRKSPS